MILRGGRGLPLPPLLPKRLGRKAVHRPEHPPEVPVIVEAHLQHDGFQRVPGGQHPLFGLFQPVAHHILQGAEPGDLFEPFAEIPAAVPRRRGQLFQGDGFPVMAVVNMDVPC